MTEAAITMSVGRDYRMSGRYEYVIYRGEQVIARAGLFQSATQARRAGVKAAQPYVAE